MAYAKKFNKEQNAMVVCDGDSMQVKEYLKRSKPTNSRRKFSHFTEISYDGCPCFYLWNFF